MRATRAVYVPVAEEKDLDVREADYPVVDALGDDDGDEEIDLLEKSSKPRDSAVAEVTDMDTISLSDSKIQQPLTEGRGGMIAAASALANSVVGVALVGVPHAFARCGLVVAVTAVVAIAIITHINKRLLQRMATQTNKCSYEELMAYAFGQRGHYAVATATFLFAYGLMLSSLIVLGDSVPQMAMHRDVPVLHNRKSVVPLAALLLILPMCLLRDLSNLRHGLALSGVTTLLFTALVIIVAPVSAANQGLFDTDNKDVQALEMVRGSMAAGIGTILFAFTNSQTAFFSATSAGSPQPTAALLDTWYKRTRFSATVTSALCLVIGIVGYGSFGPPVHGDILSSFTDRNNGVDCVRALLALTVIFTYPLQLFIARHSLHGIIHAPEKPFTDTAHLLITLVLWASTVLFACVGDEVTVVMELTGCVASSMLVLVFPRMLHERLSDAAFQPTSLQDSFTTDQDDDDDSEEAASSLDAPHRVILTPHSHRGSICCRPMCGSKWSRQSRALVAFGLFVCVVGTITSFSH